MRGIYRELRLCCLASAILMVMIFPCGAQDREQVLAGVRQRLISLQRLAIDFRFERATFPDDEGMKLDGARVGNATFRVIRGQAEGQGHFYRDGTRWQYDLTAVDGPGVRESLGWIRSVYSQSAARFEEVTIEPGGARPRGRIQDVGLLPESEYLDVGLGLRPLEGREWWTEDQLAQLVEPRNGQGSGVLEFRTPSGHLHRLTFDPERQYALIGYEGFSGQGEPFAVGTCGEFKENAGLLYPSYVHWEYYHRDGTVYKSIHYRVVSLSQNPPDDLLIEWPLRASILDERTGTTIGVRSAPQVLSDEKLKEASKGFHREYPEFAPTPTSLPSPQAGLARRWLIAVNLGLLILFVAALFYKKRRKS